MDDPQVTSEKLANRAGVVETGLFLGIAAMAIVADENNVEILKR
jgi:ribose 5-phosphate isomerase